MILKTAISLISVFYVICLSDASALSPDEILVISNGNHFDSVKLAGEYQLKRAIPEKNMLYLNCVSSERIFRDHYDEKIRIPVEKYLTDNNLKDKILCFLLIYGMPLKIDETKIREFSVSNRELARLIKDRQRFLNTAEEIAGYKKQIEENRRKSASIKKRESYASVDSELCLVFRKYRTERQFLNPYRIHKNGAMKPFSRSYDMYMVARLDGPKPKHVSRIINDTLLAEKNGLHGNAYFDTRGFKAGNSYSKMDNLLNISAGLTKKAGFNTVVEKTSALFGKGECENTAIYWGWYSLQKYRDSFTFAPGAIGVHIASNECESLKHGNIWCPQLIKHGVTVTIGPVDEPYLSAFPNPVIFLESLFEGYSLAESYFMATPYLSWQMVLVGDPLYTPFKYGLKQNSNEK